VNVRIVAISRTTGAEGEAVGRVVAEELGFRYVDEEIVAMAAEKQGVAPNLIADAEQRTGMVSRLLKALVEGAAFSGAEYAIGTMDIPTSDDYRALILEAIRETAEQGNVVIVAHAASMALAGRKDLLRVLVTASRETRASRMVQGGRAPESDVMKEIRRSDDARADYLTRFHAIDHELPTHYDLVVNTDVLSPREAADLIVLAARR
jgi:Cytidylate kinase-like family